MSGQDEVVGKSGGEWWVGVTHRMCQGVFPDISTMPWFTLLAPLVCLLVIRAIRDLVDDIVSGVKGQLGRQLDAGWGPCLSITRDRDSCPMVLWYLLSIASCPSSPPPFPGQDPWANLLV